MPDARVDLSILEPFTEKEITGYISFLRGNGAAYVAKAVEEKLDGHVLQAQSQPRIFAKS